MSGSGRNNNSAVAGKRCPGIIWCRLLCQLSQTEVCVRRGSSGGQESQDGSEMIFSCCCSALKCCCTVQRRPESNFNSADSEIGFFFQGVKVWRVQSLRMILNALFITELQFHCTVRCIFAWTETALTDWLTVSQTYYSKLQQERRGCNFK